MQKTCRYCRRTIIKEDGRWVDPEATGDDVIWRETCDAHDTLTAEHVPVTLRFVPENLPLGWIVVDTESDEPVAGPYKTEIQATFVAYHLTIDPSSSPEAPDAPDEATIVVWGNPSDGFNFVGPVVPNDADLEDFLEGSMLMKSQSWWLAPLASLDAAKKAYP